MSVKMIVENLRWQDQDRSNRTPSIRHIGGPPGSLESGLLDIFQSKKNWNFLTSISVLGL